MKKAVILFVLFSLLLSSFSLAASGNCSGFFGSSEKRAEQGWLERGNVVE